uniref:Uncharacterized protein n=1 Tax=Anguilla anguilla TaxID=7936 RepID=A0A0E9V3I5_ANGAN
MHRGLVIYPEMSPGKPPLNLLCNQMNPP